MSEKSPMLQAQENAFRARVSSYNRLYQLAEDKILEILLEPLSDENYAVQANVAMQVKKMHVKELPKENINDNRNSDLPPLRPQVIVTREETLQFMANALKLEQLAANRKQLKLAKKESNNEPTYLLAKPK